MSQTKTCPQCNAPVAATALAGLCPRCLMGAATIDSAPNPQPDEPNSDSAAFGGSARRGGFLPPKAADLAAKFPQLEALELLGHGGMGAVYKARQTNLDRVVALKIMRPEVIHDRAFAERFNREARMLARLSHPHIVTIHDFGQVEFSEGRSALAGTLFYFIMEYVDGANLRQLMQAGALTPEQALAIVPQICEALQYAHDEGVVHRDIKPENLLLDKRGRVKIADFGLAKLARHSADEVPLTAAHQVMGTLRYMAPEQLGGSDAVDHRADIYSLGVVFYEMLTGEAPTGRFDPPSKKVEIDVRLDQVVLRSLEREPERRYQHASDLKTDLQSLAEKPSSKKTAGFDDSSRQQQVTGAGSKVYSRPKAAHEGQLVINRAAQSPSILRQAWNDWWAQRDRWLTATVQGVLVVLFLICQLLFFSGGGSQHKGPERDGRTLKRTTVEYGFPAPWFHFVQNPDKRTFHSFKINFFASSVGIALVGFVFYGISWQIEKAKAAAAGRKVGWRQGSPVFVFCVWAAVVIAAVLFGMHPLTLEP